MKAFFKKLHEDAVIPNKSYAGDAGWDIAVCQDEEIVPGEIKQLTVGISIALPHEHWGHIVGRSSTWRRHGLHVMEAVIDNGYRGELFIFVRNFTNSTACVEAGTRLAQLILHKIPNVIWEEKSSLPMSDRGDKGFGSSGV